MQQACTCQDTFKCRLEVSTQVLGLDVEVLKQHKLEAKLYRDSADLTDVQPIIHDTLALTLTGASTSDRMNGSTADWHQTSAQVKTGPVHSGGSMVFLLSS